MSPDPDKSTVDDDLEAAPPAAEKDTGSLPGCLVACGLMLGFLGACGFPAAAMLAEGLRDVTGSWFAWFLFPPVALMLLAAGILIIEKAHRRAAACPRCGRALFRAYRKGCQYCGWQRRVCPRCHYDLRGRLNHGCPECGWIRDDEKHGESHRP